MTKQMGKQEAIQLTIPKQDLKKSTLFDCDKSAVNNWINTLPKANLGQSTRLLYQALTELNRVKLTPAKRFAILEQLRPSIYYVCHSLTKHYLNQAIILSEQAQQVVTLSQTLHSQLAEGYTIIALQVSQRSKWTRTPGINQLMASSLHRAITDYSLNIVTFFQLYEPIQEGYWQKLHLLYKLAQQFNLTTSLIDDHEYGKSNIKAAYVRALLTACAKPNQLRQEDIAPLFTALTQWADVCTIHPCKGSGVFVFDPQGDSAPLYRSQQEPNDDKHWLSLDTNKLAQVIHKLQDSIEADQVNVKVGEQLISINLLRHLSNVWATARKRTFTRTETSSGLTLCIGLNSTHYFVSGKKDFDTMAHERPPNTFIEAQTTAAQPRDIWSSPYESNLINVDTSLEPLSFQDPTEEEQQRESSQYFSHDVKIINASAHGYCIEWPDKANATIKNGEIIGLKEAANQEWNIANIRWVARSGNSRIQFGVELLSPTASSYGAQIIHRTGPQGHNTRVLVLPPIPVMNMPATLLTPRGPFREGQKVVLTKHDQEFQIQLTTKFSTIGAYNRFEFRRITTIAQDEPSSTQDSLDSLWENL